MDLSKSFGQDKQAAEGGKWFDLEHGGRAKVAKMGCPAFKTEVQRLQKPHLAVLRSGLDNTELIDKITVIAMAKTILTGWDGINLDGEPLAYTQENAEKILKDFPDFREVISALSAERRNFMVAEDVAGK